MTTLVIWVCGLFLLWACWPKRITQHARAVRRRFHRPAVIITSDWRVVPARSFGKGSIRRQRESELKLVYTVGRKGESR